MRVVMSKTPIEVQPTDGELVIHKWPVRRCGWIVERTSSRLCTNRRLARDYERMILSAQSFSWLAHIRRTIRHAFY